MATTEQLNGFYNEAMKLVDEAGQIIASRNAEKKKVVQKSCDVDLLTETDQQVEKLIMEGLGKLFPDHKFIGEEETAEGKKSELTDAPTWIIDPVDGTMNFVHSFPHSCISLALWINKEAEIAIVFNPILNQKFTAKRGQGAFLNDARIYASGQTDLSKVLVTTEFGTSRDVEKMNVTIENIKSIATNCHGIRALGSAALNMCMVALGAVDVNYEFGIHAWDIAAGDLIVREAGGVTMDPAGGKLDILSRRVLAASTKEVGDAFVPLLKQYYPQPRD